jgi:hypothetical protein
MEALLQIHAVNVVAMVACVLAKLLTSKFQQVLRLETVFRWQGAVR